MTEIRPCPRARNDADGTGCLGFQEEVDGNHRRTDWGRIVVVILLVASMTGCAGMSQREQRFLSGGAIGTAAGVGTAAIVGAPLIVGGAVGAAAGAVGGLIYDEVR